MTMQLLAPVSMIWYLDAIVEALGLIINFHDQTMTWDEATIPMKDYGSIPTLQAADDYCNKIFITDVENKVTTRMTQILDSKYEKANLAEVVAESEHQSTNNIIFTFQHTAEKQSQTWQVRAFWSLGEVL